MKEAEKLLIISLGSNLGDKLAHLNMALDEIQLRFQKSLKVSSFYSSSPWGFKTENHFVNCCASFYTNISPIKVLKILKEIENAGGREKKTEQNKYTSRTIDIDILYYGDMQINTLELIIPHPRLYNRNFVLKPLMEIHSDFLDPVYKKTIDQLYVDCKDDGEVNLLKNNNLLNN